MRPLTLSFVAIEYPEALQQYADGDEHDDDSRQQQQASRLLQRGSPYDADPTHVRRAPSAREPEALPISWARRTKRLRLLKHTASALPVSRN